MAYIRPKFIQEIHDKIVLIVVDDLTSRNYQVTSNLPFIDNKVAVFDKHIPDLIVKKGNSACAFEIITWDTLCSHSTYSNLKSLSQKYETHLVIPHMYPCNELSMPCLPVARKVLAKWGLSDKIHICVCNYIAERIVYDIPTLSDLYRQTYFL